MSLIPLIRSLASKCLTCCFKLVAVILSLGEIIPTYSRYAEKGLVYIIIIALLGRQSSSCVKYTKLNMRSTCNVYSVSDANYIFLTRLYTL